ncbi:hypothetical protein ACPV5O_25445 [Vibrio maritimus]|uniref:hypothetical protein n=1 Tax=Vibrio maritimus TaxID=990268 RepID=UPI0040677EFF
MHRVFSNPKDREHSFAFLANSIRNRREYERASSNGKPVKCEAVSLPLGCKLVRYDDSSAGFTLALINDLEKVVLYYCSVAHIVDKSLKIDAVCQSRVWRNRMKPAYKRLTEGFVEQIFKLYLIENYNVIISDAYNTCGGLFMWQDQLGYAVQRQDRNVFLYDQLNDQKQSITFKTLDAFLDELWCDDEEKLRYQVIVAKRQVQVTP